MFHQVHYDQQHMPIRLAGPRTNTLYGDHAFAVASPKLWNSLPIIIRLSPSVEPMKESLKYFLFHSRSKLLISVIVIIRTMFYHCCTFTSHLTLFWSAPRNIILSAL